MLFSRTPSKKQTEALAEMRDRMEEIERGFKRMKLEWEDTFDKLQAVVQRIAKRAQRAEALAADQEQETEIQPDTASSSLTLTERQRAAQQRILAQRARIARPS